MLSARFPRPRSQSPRLRVLVISQCLWPEEFRINQVLEDLAEAGAEITALTGQPNYPDGVVYSGYRALSTRRELHPAGFEIVRVPIVPRGRGNAIRLILNYFSFVASGIVFGTWLLRRRKFDVVFVYGTSPAIQGFVGVWLGWLKRAPVVQWVQDLWPQALSATGYVKSRAILGLVDRMVRAMYRRSDLALGQSHAFVRFLRGQAHPTPTGYFPNPGEKPVEFPVPQPSRGKGFAIVFAGNLGRAQALDTVIAAAAKVRDLSDLTILLYGSGAMSSWLSEAVEERGLTNVILPGRVPPDQIQLVYAQASALLLTLVDDPILSHTVPSKLQSYLAAGKPIIAGVGGEAAEIVTASGSGLTCPAGDAQALADTMRRLYGMAPGERAALGDAGRQYFNTHYHPALLTGRLLTGLSQVAAGVTAEAFHIGDRN